MKFVKTFLVILLFPYAPGKAQPVSGDECYNCHSVIGDELQKPADLYSADIHFQYGITCAECHGGNSKTDDPELSMSKASGFIGIPGRKERYLTCIKCHADQKAMQNFGSTKKTDQYENLKASVHFKPSYNNQGPVADCISCHGVHNVSRVNNPASPVYPTKVVALCGSCHSNADYMKNYNAALPIDQVSKYRTSTHGIKNSRGDIDAAECSSCHGSHNIRAVKDPLSNVYPTNIPRICSSCHSDKSRMAKYKIPTGQFDIYITSVHGKALLEKGDLNAPSCNDCHGNHGAIPPGVESISKVCGSCHSLNMELFEKSVHKVAFDKENIPECESCHGNHGIKKVNDDLVGIQNNSTCINCHKEGDKGYSAAFMMRNLMDSLKALEKEANILLTEAEQKGMDVSDAKYSIKDLRQILIETRTVLHSFEMDEFNRVIKTGFDITSEAKAEGLNAIDNYYFRRKGLAVSTLIVTLLAAGLYFRIRKIERKERSKEEIN